MPTLTKLDTKFIALLAIAAGETLDRVRFPDPYKKLAELFIKELDDTSFQDMPAYIKKTQKEHTVWKRTSDVASLNDAGVWSVAVGPAGLAKIIQLAKSRCFRTQLKLILGTMECASQKAETPCPVGRYSFKGLGNGLIALRDIKNGEHICNYPADWAVSMATIKPINPLGNNKEHIWRDSHSLAVFAANVLGFGNPHESANRETVFEATEKDDRISLNMEDYGFTCGCGEEGKDTEIWADPTLKHTNEWYVGHLMNDGVMEPGLTEEEYDKRAGEAVGSIRDGTCPDDQRTNTTLDLLVFAGRDIKKGEQIFTTYGKSYWYSGNGFQNKLVNCLTKSAVKKQKKRRKEWSANQTKSVTKFLGPENFKPKSNGAQTWEALQADRGGRKMYLGSNDKGLPVGWCESEPSTNEERIISTISAIEEWDTADRIAEMDEIAQLGLCQD